MAPLQRRAGRYPAYLRRLNRPPPALPLPEPPTPPPPLERGIGYRIGFVIGRGVRVLLRLALAVVVLLLLATLALQIPAVQRWAVRQTAQQVSTLLGAEFGVGAIGIVPFTQLALSDVYLLDESRDTLLTTRQLDVTFFRPLRSLWDGSLFIESVGLRGARLDLQRDSLAADGNYAFVLERLGIGQPRGPDDGRVRRPLKIDLRQLSLTDVAVALDDQLRGQRVDAQLGTLLVELDRLDLPGKRIDGQRVAGDGITVRVLRYPGQTTRLDPPVERSDPAESAPDSAAFALLPDFQLVLGEVDLTDCRVAFDDEGAVSRPAGTFDARHFDFEEVVVRLRDIRLSPDSLGLALEEVRFGESRSGLQLDELRIGAVVLTPAGARLDDLLLRTPSSRLDSRLSVRLRGGADWRDVAAAGRFDLRLDDSYVGVRDLLALAPGLSRFGGLGQYRGGRIDVSGELDGTSDNLRAAGLSLRLPDGSTLRADLSVRNLQTPREAFLFVDVTELATDVERVRAWLPDVRVPEPFARLGALRFSGKFVGFVTDFTASGDFRTGLGRATLDTRFVRRGEVPTYTGTAELQGFDLGRFIDNPQVGLVTAKVRIRDGQGLRRETVRLNLEGAVDALGFRDYEYHSITINGALDPEGFEGQVTSADPNADFAFDGSLDARAGRERFGFTVDVRNVDPNALKLWDNGWSGRGRFTVNSNSLDIENLEGTVEIDSLSVRNVDGRHYDFDRLVATQTLQDNGDKQLVFESPQVNLTLSGSYRLKPLPQSLQAAFAKTYPNLFARTRLRPLSAPDSLFTRLNLTARLLAVDTVLEVFGLPVSQLDGAALAFSLDEEREDLDLSFLGVSPVVAGVQLGGFGFALRGQSGDLQLEGRVASLGLAGGKFGFTNVDVFSEYSEGDLRFGLSSDTTTRVLGEIKLGGGVRLLDTAVVVELDASSHLDVSGERWVIDGGNRLTLGRRRVRAENLVLRSGERFVEVESVGERGVNVLIRQFDLGLANAYLNPEKIQIGGTVDAYLSAEDIYAQTGITASLSVDTFEMNGVDWGALQTLVRRADSTQAVTMYTTFTRDGQQAIIEGAIATSAGQVVDGRARERNYFDATVTSQDFDMSFLGYFIPGITDLRGKLGADLRFSGTPAYVVPSGGILVEDVGITVDYLQTRYFVDSQFVSVDERRLDATGRQIRDRFGNVATLTGGLTHQGMKNWALDVSLRASRLEVLRTGKRDNPLFYGDAFMNGKVGFRGPFNRTDITINATALQDTRIVFPVSGTAAESELRFIRFRQPEDTVRQVAATSLRGLNLDMDLRVTPAAELLIVFDEAAGDIMRAQGSGDFAIDIKRSGEYTMFGNFLIDQGEYLFTLLNVVNKPFSIREGGTISWTGDPFLAELDLVAKYEGLQAAPAGLIGPLLQGQPNLVNQANLPTPVDLELRLTGDLLRPTVAFDIELPELQGQLRNYTNSRLALIRADPDQLNRQVFGLVVIGQFLPEFNELQASSVGFNTISELFSNQLSFLLTELFTSLAGGNGALSGIDFDINLQSNSSLSGGGSLVGNDIRTRLRTYFLEDRLEIGVGVSVGGQASNNQGSLTAGNFDVVYAISDDRRLRLRAFVSRDVDLANANRTRAGVGLTYRREFDGFAELLGAARREREKGRDLEVDPVFGSKGGR